MVAAIEYKRVIISLRCEYLYAFRVDVETDDHIVQAHSFKKKKKTNSSESTSSRPTSAKNN